MQELFVFSVCVFYACTFCKDVLIEIMLFYVFIRGIRIDVVFPLTCHIQRSGVSISWSAVC